MVLEGESKKLGSESKKRGGVRVDLKRNKGGKILKRGETPAVKKIWWGNGGKQGARGKKIQLCT